MRDRFGFLAPLVLTLFGEPQHVRAWVRGAKGERVVGLVLDELVAQEPGAAVLHDRRFKGSRGNLDHIVVCRGGVFVVDAKNYRGRIEVRGRWSSSPSLWVGGRRATKLTESVERQAEGVQRLLEAASVKVTVQPVLFFVDGNWSSGASRRRIGRVQLLGGRRSLRKHLSRSEVLDPEAVAAAIRQLEDQLVAAA
ncbi:nuclease-related domain-containing protein [Auraticoccus monumenti]|uniref:nuclease-related domain-containing protein n=1 Tax=Auraticoccus monumenti TaxID=675864 RepID=UPI0012F7DDDC|nr:nuclease-related domain-containing protein [Auraticoccus monumenti]